MNRRNGARRLACALILAATTLPFSINLTKIATRRVQADPPPSAIPGVRTAQLPNGLRLAVVERPNAPQLAVQVWYRVGSKDEPADRRGLAHMFEHLMFMGSARVRPEAHARMINATGGYVGATTMEDATFFQNVVPAGYLPFALRLEADRMRGLSIRDTALAQARAQMAEELRQQAAQPVTKGLMALLAAAYGTHPYAWTASGVADELTAITTAEAQAFYDAAYRPDNAMLVVVGKTTIAEVQAAAADAFGSIAAAAPSPERAAMKKRAEAAQATAAQWMPGAVRGVDASGAASASGAAGASGAASASGANGAIGLVFVGAHVPPGNHEDIAALQVTSALLGGGPDARLAKRLQGAPAANAGSGGRPLAVQTAAPLLVREQPGLLVAFAAYLDPRDGEAIKAALLDELKTLAVRPVGAAELAVAKAQVMDAAMSQLERGSDLAQLIGTSWIVGGAPDAFAMQYARLGRVTAADIQRVAATYLDVRRAIVIVEPPAVSKASKP